MLYVLRCGKFFKIGVTAQLELRLSKYAQHNPYECKVVYKFKTQWAGHIERIWHAAFLEAWEYGEWFLLTPEMFKRIKTETPQLAALAEVDIDARADSAIGCLKEAGWKNRSICHRNRSS